MRARTTEIRCAVDRDLEGCRSRTQDAQRAFAVLSMAPGAGLPAPDAITAVCEDIAGVNAVHIDAKRGKIHLLYDGSTSAIDQLASLLRQFGLEFRHPEDGRPSMRHAHSVEEDPA